MRFYFDRRRRLPKTYFSLKLPRCCVKAAHLILMAIDGILFSTSTTALHASFLENPMSTLATCIGREEKMKKTIFLTRSPCQLLFEQVPGPTNSGFPAFKGILGSGRVCVQVSQDSMSYRFWRSLTRRTAYDRNLHVMPTKPWHKILQNLLPLFFLTWIHLSSHCYTRLELNIRESQVPAHHHTAPLGSSRT